MLHAGGATGMCGRDEDSTGEERFAQSLSCHSLSSPPPLVSPSSASAFLSGPFVGGLLVLVVVVVVGLRRTA